MIDLLVRRLFAVLLKLRAWRLLHRNSAGDRQQTGKEYRNCRYSSHCNLVVHLTKRPPW
jgi:hypothetical protein